MSAPELDRAVIVDRKLLGAEQEFFCGLWSKPWSSAVSSDYTKSRGSMIDGGQIKLYT
jgi:hypothetical protein